MGRRARARRSRGVPLVPRLRREPEGTRPADDTPPTGAPPPDLETLRSLWHAAVGGGRGGTTADDRLVAAVADPDARDLVAAVALSALARTLGPLWDRGWQPADVVRAARKWIDPKVERVVALVVLLESSDYVVEGQPLHPEWASQLDALRTSLRGAAGSDPTWQALRALSRCDDHHLLLLLVAAARQLPALPELPILVPPPSGWADDPATRLRWAAEQGTSGDIDARVLQKIRALLAKAESTTFPEEAEALTTKAQDLIARHAIDSVLLSAGRGDDDAPIGRRIPLDDPYAETKSMLLSVVADANRCRSVYLAELSVSTVFGYAADLRAVELLFTSLLVQATSAMVAAGEEAASGSHQRSRGFRRAFLSAYAVRIGQRLAEASAGAEHDADVSSGGTLLPALARRRDAVDAAVDHAFPRLTTRRSRSLDAQGWHAGTAAADAARLDQQEVGGRSPRVLGTGN